MSGKAVYCDESCIWHTANALAKIVEKSHGVTRKDLVEGGGQHRAAHPHLTILGAASNSIPV